MHSLDDTAIDSPARKRGSQQGRAAVRSPPSKRLSTGADDTATTSDAVRSPYFCIRNDHLIDCAFISAVNFLDIFTPFRDRFSLPLDLPASILERPFMRELRNIFCNRYSTNNVM